MKIFQIVGGICHKDVTMLANHHDLSKITALQIVEAPDYVFGGWGFDPDREGDERFVKPIPPRGHIYNEKTGCMELENPPEPATEPDVWDELDAAYMEGVNTAYDQ